MVSIKEIIGISDSAAERLREAGVRTREQLTELGSTSSGRMRLADETGLDDEMIKLWVHQADLLRVNGVEANIAHLLCMVGVCTVPKLAYYSADETYEKLKVYAEQVRQPQSLPSLAELRGLIASAKLLPKLIQH